MIYLSFSAFSYPKLETIFNKSWKEGYLDKPGYPWTQGVYYLSLFLKEYIFIWQKRAMI